MRAAMTDLIGEPARRPPKYSHDQPCEVNSDRCLTLLKVPNRINRSGHGRELTNARNVNPPRRRWTQGLSLRSGKAQTLHPPSMLSMVLYAKDIVETDF